MRSRPISMLAALVLPALFAVSGCTPAVSLPRAEIPGPGAPTPEGEPTISTADADVVVLYYVNCRQCDVTYTTPNGMATRELSGGREFRVVFNRNGPGQGVVLQVTPDRNERVLRARIRVGGDTLAESGLTAIGDPVNLSAAIS